MIDIGSEAGAGVEIGALVRVSLDARGKSTTGCFLLGRTLSSRCSEVPVHKKLVDIPQIPAFHCRPLPRLSCPVEPSNLELSVQVKALSDDQEGKRESCGQRLAAITSPLFNMDTEMRIQARLH